MTDEKLDQILKQALSPEINDSEILIRRKDYSMIKKKLVVCGLAACAAFALLITGINYKRVSHSGNENVVSSNEAENSTSTNWFAITAYASELPQKISSGDVVNISNLTSSWGDSAFLEGRFTLSGDNIDKVKISTDKCDIYTAFSIYENDPEFSDAKDAEAHGERDYVMVYDDFADEDKYHYEHLTIAGSRYEGDFDNQISFGMYVPEELWSTNDELPAAYRENVDQVNGATLTIEVTFADGSIETHHYKLTTGKIFVPCDENGYCEYDNLTRFVSSKDETYIYGFLVEKMD